jgi:hypothetical protein
MSVQVRILAMAFLVWLGAAGCDSGQDGGDAGYGADTGVEGSGEAAAGNVLTDKRGEIAYTSEEGDFRVVWPDGCSRIRVRTQVDPAGGDPSDLLKAHIFCDRKERENEGCSVTVYFKKRSESGGPPDPPMVIGLCKSVMQNFGVDIVNQKPIRRGQTEGIQLQCQEPEDFGQVWVEGLLQGEKIYILMAWKGSGDMFADKDFIRFFGSFSAF